MKTEDLKHFFEHETIRSLRQEAEKLRNTKDWAISDIIDEEGHQYVDLVQEGGGVLGIALVGYTWMLETLGIRFFHLAGTSAGAINTVLMAGMGPIQEPKSDLLLRILLEKDLFDLVDGDPRLRRITQKLIEGTPFRKMIFSLLFNFGKIREALFYKLGINPGTHFEQWIDELLEQGPASVRTMDQLMELRKKAQFPDQLINRETGLVIPDEQARLALITADITTRTKVVFPDMASLYFREPGQQKPSRLVRASMSVPLFFRPNVIRDIPDAGKDDHPEWIRQAVYYGRVPQQVSFVDGGLISNFPINVFHVPGGNAPRKPTFGVRLSTFRENYDEINDLGSFLGGLIGTMRHDADNEFLRKNPDFNQLICYINADQVANWLNFKLPMEDKQKLFIRGAESALNFIREFDWEQYKNLRKKRI